MGKPTRNRSGFSFATPDELREMAKAQLDAYFAWLRYRLSWLRGPGRKSTEKRLDQAVRIRSKR